MFVTGACFCCVVCSRDPCLFHPPDLLYCFTKLRCLFRSGGISFMLQMSYMFMLYWPYVLCMAVFSPTFCSAVKISGDELICVLMNFHLMICFLSFWINDLSASQSLRLVSICCSGSDLARRLTPHKMELTLVGWWRVTQMISAIHVQVMRTDKLTRFVSRNTWIIYV